MHALMHFWSVRALRLALLKALWLLLACTPLHAAEPVTYLDVTLLQPSAVLEARVASIDAMADYIKAVQAAARDVVAASSAKQSAGGYIVIAVRPPKQSNAWLDFDTLIDLELAKQIVAKVRAVPPFEVRDAPVVFALKLVMWDGKPIKRAVPLPIEWKNAGRGLPPMEVEALVQKVWGGE